MSYYVQNYAKNEKNFVPIYVRKYLKSKEMMIEYKMKR